MNIFTLGILTTFLNLLVLSACGQNFGSEVCKTGVCQPLILLGASCGYVLDRATSLTAAQAYCTCNAVNFTRIIKPCLECMEPYDLPIYTESTWERLCPNAKAALEADDDDDESSAPSSTNGRVFSIISSLVVVFGIGFMGATM